MKKKTTRPMDNLEPENETRVSMERNDSPEIETSRQSMSKEEKVSVASKSTVDESGPQITGGAKTPQFEEIRTREELNAFLHNVLDKMNDVAAPLYCMSALNFVMSHPDIYTFMDHEAKETAKTIWLRIKAAGFQLKNPPLLFADEVV